MRLLTAALMMFALVAAPATAQPSPNPGSFGIAMSTLPDAFNRTADRLRRGIRMRSMQCDPRARVATCQIRMGDTIQAVAAAAADRTTLQDVTLIASPIARTAVRVNMIEAVETIAVTLAPTISLDEREALIRALLRSEAAYRGEQTRHTVSGIAFSAVRVPSHDAVMVSVAPAP